MTAQEAIDKYTEIFGGWPAYLLMGAEDSEIVEALEPCIKSGKEYEPPVEGADY